MLYIVQTNEGILRMNFISLIKRSINSPLIKTWRYLPPSDRFVFRAVSWRDYGSIGLEHYGNNIHKLKLVFYPNRTGQFTDDDLDYARAVYLADFTQMLLVHFTEYIHRLSIYP